MSLTAFIPTGAPQILPFIGTPGAATVGHALVWSQTPQGFTLAPIAVGPDQFSGVLPVSKGGWGTNTGSFTSPGAITLAAGGTNQNIALNPSGGSGSVEIKNNLKITIGQNARDGISLINSSDNSFAALGNGSSGGVFVPFFWSEGNFAGTTSLGFQAQQFGGQNNQFGVITFFAASQGGLGNIASGNNAFGFFNGPGSTALLIIRGSGDSRFFSATESTSTTTGAVCIDGGLGVAKSLYAAGAAGSKVNFANLPTASTGLNPGDLWRDSNGFLRIV